MVNLIGKLFIKDYENYSSPEVKERYAKICSIIGIAINLLLFGFKFTVGVVSKSVAIKADGINNLTDVVVACISLIGFFIASIGAGSHHPYGHGRFEWIVGLFSSMLIIMLGIDLVKDSILSIKTPKSVEFSILLCVVLILSILAKFYMYIYNKNIGAKIESVEMMAVASDSFSDMISTSLIFISIMIQHFFAAFVDGWCGLVVSALIIISGIKAMTESIHRILGEAPKNKLVNEISSIVKKYPLVYGISDLNIHDYGMGHIVVSMHLECKTQEEKRELAYLSYEIEEELYKKYNCDTTIQVDVLNLSKEMEEKVKRLTNKAITSVNIDAYLKQYKVIEREKYSKIVLVIAYDHMEQSKQNQLLKEIKKVFEEENSRDYLQVKFMLEVLQNSHFGRRSFIFNKFKKRGQE